MTQKRKGWVCLSLFLWVRTEEMRARRETGTKTGMYGLLVAALVLAYATHTLWETQKEVIPLNCGLLLSVL